MVCVAADTRCADKQPPCCLRFHMARLRLFHLVFSFIQTFCLVICSFCKSSCPLPGLSLPLYVTGLSLEWANKDDYSEWQAAWLNGCSYLQCAGCGMAAAHVPMTASHWTKSGAIQYLPLYTCRLLTGLRGVD